VFISLILLQRRNSGSFSVATPLVRRQGGGAHGVRRWLADELEMKLVANKYLTILMPPPCLPTSGQHKSARVSSVHLTYFVATPQFRQLFGCNAACQATRRRQKTFYYTYAAVVRLANSRRVTILLSAFILVTGIYLPGFGRRCLATMHSLQF